MHSRATFVGVGLGEDLVGFGSKPDDKSDARVANQECLSRSEIQGGWFTPPRRTPPPPLPRRTPPRRQPPHHHPLRPRVWEHLRPSCLASRRTTLSRWRPGTRHG